ncbi:MAG: SDR family NAD(P)-dependent oxidoreductase [Luteitalea sp.]|nr:SDR family NAD(P)-dependent oxidoreductase [Luteitalea sp.]
MVGSMAALVLGPWSLVLGARRRRDSNRSSSLPDDAQPPRQELRTQDPGPRTKDLRYDGRMARDLAGRTVAITGASAGIGAACARACAGRGMHVALAARRADRLARLADELRTTSRMAIPVIADVTSEADMHRLAGEAAQTTGRLDVMICNAGIGYHGALEDTPVEIVRHLMDVNLLGSLHAARAALPLFRSQGSGHLVFVSSIVGRRGLPLYSAYCATKFAQAGLAEALRTELAGSGIHVSVVFPISTDTEFREVMVRDFGRRVGGLGPRQSAEQVADAIVRCLTRPRAEVYPHRLSRLLPVLNAMAPAVGDRIMRRFTRHRRS